MKSVHALFAAMLSLFACDALVVAEDQKSDFDRLQGTWKSVEVEQRGVRSTPRLPKTWIFDGKVLSTQLAGLTPIVFEFELNSKAEPKELDLYLRGANSKPQRLPDRFCYRFVGDTLEVIQGGQLNQRPKSFDTKDEKTSALITAFKKLSTGAPLPQEDVLPHSKNADAEAALLKFFEASLKRESAESIEPYVAGGMAKTLFPLLPKLAVSREALDAELKITGGRDIQAGERIYYATGTEKIIVPGDLTDSKTLLMIVQGQRELGFFWVVQERKTWKVDVTNLIGLLRSPGPSLFRGIRAGMEVAKATKLLEDYKGSGAINSWKQVRKTNSELVVDVVDHDVPTRLEFSIVDGKLTGVVTVSSFKAK